MCSCRWRAGHHGGREPDDHDGAQHCDYCALIGAGGLGREVLVALQRLQVGRALEAGLAVVLLAIIMDRISDALANRQSEIYVAGANTGYAAKRPAWQRARIVVPLVAAVLLLGALVLGVQSFPEASAVAAISTGGCCCGLDARQPLPHW